MRGYATRFLFCTLTTLCVIGTQLRVSAQEPASKWWVKANPFGLFAGQFQASYERAVSDKVTVQMTGGVVRSNLELNTDDLESLLSINTSLNAVDWIPGMPRPACTCRPRARGAWAPCARSVHHDHDDQLWASNAARLWAPERRLAVWAISQYVRGTCFSVRRSSRRPPHSTNISLRGRRVAAGHPVRHELHRRREPSGAAPAGLTVDLLAKKWCCCPTARCIGPPNRPVAQRPSPRQGRAFPQAWRAHRVGADPGDAAPIAGANSRPAPRADLVARDPFHSDIREWEPFAGLCEEFAHLEGVLVRATTT